MSLSIRVIGAGGGPILHVHGRNAGAENIWLGEGQVDGIYDAPVDTEWARTRRQRGGRLRAVELPERDIVLGFHTVGDKAEQWERADGLLRRAFTYELDPWWPGDTLARIEVETGRDRRSIAVQMSDEPEFAPEQDPAMQAYGNIFYRLRAADPMWESPATVTSWETGGSSGTGTIEVSNPTDQPMFQTWVLTPGKWTVADHQWEGPRGLRAPGGEHAARTVTVDVKADMGGVRISLDPAERMVADLAGTNVLGRGVTGNQFFVHEIPPYTPVTDLPISVTGAPAGGARAELHQPRLWSRPWGLR